jgi:hypothetical protein
MDVIAWIVLGPGAGAGLADRDRADPVRGRRTQDEILRLLRGPVRYHNDPLNSGIRGKCSNIKNIAPDPGSGTRIKFAAAAQGRIFSLYGAGLAKMPHTDER